MRNIKPIFSKQRERLQMLNRSVSGRLATVVSIIVIANICLVAFGLGARERNPSPVRADTQRKAIVSSVVEATISQAKQAPVTLPGVAVILTPNGFEPRQITRPPGKFVLAVIPQIGLSTLSFSLDDGRGRHLRSAQVPREQLHSSDAYDLAPGTYALREADHPEWICQITIKQ